MCLAVGKLGFVFNIKCHVDILISVLLVCVCVDGLNGRATRVKVNKLILTHSSYLSETKNTKRASMIIIFFIDHKNDSFLYIFFLFV